jgi:hypothetical protein
MKLDPFDLDSLHRRRSRAAGQRPHPFHEKIREHVSRETDVKIEMLPRRDLHEHQTRAEMKERPMENRHKQNHDERASQQPAPPAAASTRFPFTFRRR